MLVALHRGRGFIAQAIQWQTRSVYSHASVVFEETGVVIEAREFKGVRSILWDEVVASGEAVDVFRVKGLVPEAEEAVGEFLQGQLGKPYDYSMVARFITREQAAREESGKWFCSELVFAAFAQAGVKLLERIEPWAVSPGMLRLSTKLEEAQVKPQNTRKTRNEEGSIAENAKGAERGSVRCDEGLFRDWLRSGVDVGAVRTPRPTNLKRKDTAAEIWMGGGEGLGLGATSEGDWTGGGACPTTGLGQARGNGQSTIADSQGGICVC